MQGLISFIACRTSYKAYIQRFTLILSVNSYYFKLVKLKFIRTPTKWSWLFFFIIFNPSLRDELANIENRILEKKIADKKKEELRKKNIAVSEGNPQNISTDWINIKPFSPRVVSILVHPKHFIRFLVEVSHVCLKATDFYFFIFSVLFFVYEIQFNLLQMYGDSKRAQRLYQQDSDAEEEEDLQPNPKLGAGKACPQN